MKRLFALVSLSAARPELPNTNGPAQPPRSAMTRFIALISLSTALAVGTTSCAHGQLTKRRAVETVATAAVIAGMVVLAAQANCGNCNIGIDDPNTSAHPAQPPH